MQNERADSGFTLLETIVVLVIAGLIAGMVLQRGPLRSARAEFLRERSLVLSTLRGARLEAALGGMPVGIRFDPASHSLLKLSGDRTLERVSLNPEVVIAASGNGMMQFNPDGTGAEARWVLRYRSYDMAMSVSPLTGRVITDAR